MSPQTHTTGGLCLFLSSLLTWTRHLITPNEPMYLALPQSWVPGVPLPPCLQPGRKQLQPPQSSSAPNWKQLPDTSDNHNNKHLTHLIKKHSRRNEYRDSALGLASSTPGCFPNTWTKHTCSSHWKSTR